MATITPNSTVSNATAIGLAKAMGATPAQISALTGAVSSPQATQATIAAAKSAPSGQLFPTSPNNLSVSSSPITAEAMKPQQQIQLPAVPTPTDYFSTVMAGNTALGVKPIDAKTPQTAMDASQNNMQDYFKQYISGMEKPPSLSNEYAQAESDAGIAQKQQLVNDYSTQLNSIAAKAQADQLALVGQGRGIPEVIIGGQQAKIGREAAIQALPIQALLAASQQNLQFAQSRLDTLFKLKMEDATNLYNYKKDLYDKVYDFATAQEKKRLDELKANNERVYAEKQDFLKTQSAMLSSAVSQGAPQAVVNAIGSATNANEAIMAAGIYGGTIKPKAGFELSAGQTRYEYDPKTGKAVAVASVAPKAGVGTTPSGGKLSANAQAVIENPNLLNSYTNTVKGQVIAELQQAGYDTSNLGVKPLSDTAIKEINQTETALASLQSLRDVINENLTYVGPISGLQKYNPYSKARQVQAEVDRVRQMVGKALEGGVLRKEDEEKYKKILATITDTPETALYKIDALISTIKSDTENYKNLQLEAGRTLDIKKGLEKKGTETKTEDLRTKYNY